MLQICCSIYEGIAGVLSAWAWPIMILIIAIIFKDPLTALINRLKKAKVADIEFGFNDYVPVSDPDKPDVKYMIKLVNPQDISTLTVQGMPFKLGDQRIEESKRRAQKRLDEDTRNVGYQRGELKENEDGTWSIAWGGKYPL